MVDKVIISKDNQCRVCATIGDDEEVNRRLFEGIENVDELIRTVFAKENIQLTSREISDHVKAHILAPSQEVDRWDIDNIIEVLGKKIDDKFDTLKRLKIMDELMQMKIIELRGKPQSQYFVQLPRMVEARVKILDLIDKIEKSRGLTSTSGEKDSTEFTFGMVLHEIFDNCDDDDEVEEKQTTFKEMFNFDEEGDENEIKVENKKMQKANEGEVRE